MNYEKIRKDYIDLFPKKLNGLYKYTSWNEWQKSINSNRKPYIDDFKVSLVRNKVSINCKLYYDCKMSDKKTLVPTLEKYRIGGEDWKQKVRYDEDYIRTLCIDYYTDEFLLDNDSITRFFKLLEFLMTSESLIKSSEYQQIRSVAYKITKYAKKHKPKPKKQPLKKEYCYIMKDTVNGLYKIGMSNNPKARERTLQSEKPSIKMIKVFSENIEKELHKRYKAQRVRGEWFNLNKIQLRYICTHY